MNRSFRPVKPGSTQKLSATSTSSGVTFAQDVASQSRDLYLLNTGPNVCFVRLGNGSQTATVSDMPIPVNVPVYLDKAAQDSIAVITGGTDTATLYVTPGNWNS